MAIEAFRVIALGEFIPYDWLTDPIKDLLSKPEEDTDSDEDAEDEAEDEADEEKDVSKANVLANMGVMLVILAVILVVIILVIILIRSCKKGTCCHRQAMKIKAKIFWNSILRYVLQSYLKTSLGCLFALAAISFKNSSATTNALISMLMFVVLLAQPIIFACVMERNKENLQRKKIKAKIGAAYLGIRTKHWT